MNLRRVGIAVLLVLAIGSWWMLNPDSGSDGAAPAPELSAGYYLVDATIADTDDAGRLIYSLEARHIDHNPRDDSVSLQELQLLYATDSSEHWQIRAAEGWMDGNREQLILRGKVRITGQFATDARNTVINTTRLILNLKDDIARTNETVEIEVAGGRLHADGMHANLKSQEIKLLSNVRGTFQSGT